MSGQIQGNSALQTIDSITQFVNATQAAWNSINIPIPAGMVIYAIDTTVVKMGDGQTLYANLPVLFTLSDITTILSTTSSLSTEYTTLQQAITALQTAAGNNDSGIYAALAGSATQTFLVANATADTQEAVPISQADARYVLVDSGDAAASYAALTGSSSQTFLVADATAGTQEAIPIAQADTRYQAIGDYQAAGSYQPSGSYANINGDSTQTFEVADATAGSQDALPISQADTLYQPVGEYAALSGNDTQTFLVANATADTQEAIPISQADTRYQAAGDYVVSGTIVTGSPATAQNEFTTLSQVGAPNRRVTFPSSGSWTCPAGITKVLITACGGGGGGGGGFIGPSNNYYGGGGGGGAQAVLSSPLTVVPGTTYTITVGAAGTGGAFNASGTSGGATSFDSLLTLSGGGGGQVGYLGSAAAGAGGTAGGAGGVAGMTGGLDNSLDLIFGGGCLLGPGFGQLSGMFGGGGTGSTSAGTNGAPGFLMVEF